MEYTEFLHGKKPPVIESVNPALATFDRSKIHPSLLGHQKDIATWAIRGGRRAIFAAFGLGKTLIQLEVMNVIQRTEKKPVLIICPLGVRHEFAKDANIIGVKTKYIRTVDEIEPDTIHITNYEPVRDGKLDVKAFVAVSLDEASVLRSYGSKTYQTFLNLFSQTPYRYVATATPAPNRFKELIHYGGFLGIMDTGQALTRFFQRDSTKANELTLYPHKEDEFFAWLSTWAAFVQRPSDLGYSNEGYDLPPLKVHYHEIHVDDDTPIVERDGQSKLWRDQSVGLSSAAAEKRASLPQRVAKAKEIIEADPEDSYIIWHTLEAERHALRKAIPTMQDVYGTQDWDERERRVIGFAEGKIKHLGTKPEISGSGCNFQHHCHKEIFIGLDYKFNDFIQSIHRVHRFQQKEQVEIHIIHTDNERSILAALLSKWERHKELMNEMETIIMERGLNDLKLAEVLERSIGCERIAIKEELFTAVNNDCVAELTDHVGSDSVGLVVTSIPFANHYEYSPSYNDFGHTKDNGEFWGQMDFLTPQIERVLMPGRVYAVHVKDRINFGNTTGYGFPTVSPFHAECIMHCIQHGLRYMGMITVVTDVVRENNQTYRLGWSENAKDGTKMGVGSPEYVLLFRKQQTDATKGYADIPVAKSKEIYSRARWQVDAHAFWRSSGNRQPTYEELAQMGPDKLASFFTAQSLESVYNYEEHVYIGESLDARGVLPSTFMSLAPGSHDPSVWHDVTRMQTLNTAQSSNGREKHICPLQFDIIDRLIDRYSNPGDVVLDPFGGIMSTPYRAVLKGRKGYGVELNGQYWKDGCSYLRAAVAKVDMPTLFDTLEELA